MTDATNEPEPVGDVEWHTDPDGTQWFEEDGVRYELADDGYAYPVTDQADVSGNGDHAAPDDSGAGTESDETREIPPVSVDEDSRRAPSSNGHESARSEGGSGRLLLELEDVRSGYGSLPVLHGVDFAVHEGETAVLLGLNGAGKTTTAMNICGALETWDGSIRFDGEEIAGWSTRKCVNAGIVMVPEGRRVFPELSVEKNLLVGAWSQRRESGFFEEQRDRVFEYFPRLEERTSQLAGTLSGGEQQMLAIGRGLMGRPKLIIIDEASMGLAPVIVQDVFDIVKQINEDGTTVLMIEQNISALEEADLGLVMEQGRIIKELRGDRLDDLSEVSDILMG